MRSWLANNDTHDFEAVVLNRRLQKVREAGLNVLALWPVEIYVRSCLAFVVLESWADLVAALGIVTPPMGPALPLSLTFWKVVDEARNAQTDAVYRCMSTLCERKDDEANAVTIAFFKEVLSVESLNGEAGSQSTTLTPLLMNADTGDCRSSQARKGVGTDRRFYSQFRNSSVDETAIVKVDDKLAADTEDTALLEDSEAITSSSKFVSNSSSVAVAKVSSAYIALRTRIAVALANADSNFWTEHRDLSVKVTWIFRCRRDATQDVSGVFGGRRNQRPCFGFHRHSQLIEPSLTGAARALSIGKRVARLRQGKAIPLEKLRCR